MVLGETPCFPVSKPRRNGEEPPVGKDVQNQHANNIYVGIGSADVYGEGKYKKPSNDAPDNLSNSTGKADSQSNMPLEISTAHCSHSLPLVLMCYVHSPALDICRLDGA